MSDRNAGKSVYHLPSNPTLQTHRLHVAETPVAYLQRLQRRQIYNRLPRGNPLSNCNDSDQQNDQPAGVSPTGPIARDRNSGTSTCDPRGYPTFDAQSQHFRTGVSQEPNLSEGVTLRDENSLMFLQCRKLIGHRGRFIPLEHYFLHGRQVGDPQGVDPPPHLTHHRHVTHISRTCQIRHFFHIEFPAGNRR